MSGLLRTLSSDYLSAGRQTFLYLFLGYTYLFGLYCKVYVPESRSACGGGGGSEGSDGRASWRVTLDHDLVETLSAIYPEWFKPQHRRERAASPASPASPRTPCTPCTPPSDDTFSRYYFYWYVSFSNDYTTGWDARGIGSDSCESWLARNRYNIVLVVKHFKVIILREILVCS